jgi:hypothetical protein
MHQQAVAFATAMMLGTALPASAGTACEAHSGPNTAVLIELYTSEGCSSCPPADKQLGQLAKSLASNAEFVPLALHVGYWNSPGWKDRFAQEQFAQRQDWLVHTNNQRTVYTPQFFVAGSEFQAWNSSLRDTVLHLNAKPAAAIISLHTKHSAANVLKLDATATTHVGDDTTALYLAIAENGLVTKVKGGENQGVTLAHDHVVREWFGPFRLHDGKTQVQREVILPAAWHRDHLETIAFVQDEHSGAVLQALRASSCLDM